MPVEPLHARIAAKLLEAIAAGHYPAGSLLPTELELSRQLGVSRHTLRVALDTLEAQGRVSRRKNVGTRVEMPVAPAYSQSLGTIDELVQWASLCQRQIQSSRVIIMEKANARRLGCEPGSEWLRVTSLRFDHAQQQLPVALTEAYIDARYRAILPQLRKEPKRLIASALADRYGVSLPTVEQQVCAVPLSQALAGELGASGETVGLLVLRRYLNTSGNPVLVTQSTHPASRFVLNMRMTQVSAVGA
jgi:GntR family transcriptional regulator